MSAFIACRFFRILGNNMTVDLTGPTPWMPRACSGLLWIVRPQFDQCIEGEIIPCPYLGDYFLANSDRVICKQMNDSLDIVSCQERQEEVRLHVYSPFSPSKGMAVYEVELLGFVSLFERRSWFPDSQCLSE